MSRRPPDRAAAMMRAPTSPSARPARPASGPRPAPARPRKRQTFAELRDLQRLAMKVITRPLAPGYRMQPKWEDGRPTGEVIERFIKPNDRLTAAERIQIYNKQYWFRILDCFYDDYPGLRTLLGERKFDRLRVAYLEACPSQSFTLRNLGSRLVQFLRDHPEYAAPYQAMALDMAGFEWAQVVAFDGAALPALTVDDLLGRDPATLRLSLQPYITLLEMGYALDDYILAVRKREATLLRSEASNAIEQEASRPPRRTPPRRPKPQRVLLAVHRLDNDLYYKRLSAEAFTILCALRDGKTLAAACAAALKQSEDPHGAWVGDIQDWFRAWTRMGWFHQR